MLIPIIILNNSPAVARLWSRERENYKPQLIAPLLQRYKTFSAVISGILTRMPSNQDPPLKTYLDHLARGELAYQFSPEAQPRVARSIEMLVDPNACQSYFDPGFNLSKSLCSGTRTAGPSHPLNLPFRMRSGTTRATARAMPESFLARSGTDANPHTLKPMDCRTEPPRPLSDVISSTLDCGLIRRLDDSRSNSTRDSSRANHLARRASGPPQTSPGVFRLSPLEERTGVPRRIAALALFRQTRRYRCQTHVPPLGRCKASADMAHRDRTAWLGW
jgi:hypothetical protein